MAPWQLPTFCGSRFGCMHRGGGRPCHRKRAFFSLCERGRVVAKSQQLVASCSCVSFSLGGQHAPFRPLHLSVLTPSHRPQRCCSFSPSKCVSTRKEGRCLFLMYVCPRCPNLRSRQVVLALWLSGAQACSMGPVSPCGCQYSNETSPATSPPSSSSPSSYPSSYPSPLPIPLRPPFRPPTNAQARKFTEVLVQPRTLRTLYGVPDGERGGGADDGSNRQGLASFDGSYLDVRSRRVLPVGSRMYAFHVTARHPLSPPLSFAAAVYTSLFSFSRLVALTSQAIATSIHYNGSSAWAHPRQGRGRRYCSTGVRHRNCTVFLAQLAR